MPLFTKVQPGVSGTDTTGTTTQAILASNPTPGNIVGVGVLFFDGGTTIPTVAIADGNSNAYTLESHNSGNTLMATAGIVFQAYLVAPANAEKTITVTFNRTISAAALWVTEFANTGGAISYDNGAAETNGSGVITTPLIPVAGLHELVLSIACDANDISTPTGAWVVHDGGNHFGAGCAYILDVSSATAVGFAGSVGEAYGSAGMSFKIPASGAILHPGSVM